MSAAGSPGPGHNSGELNLAAALEPTQLQADLAADSQHLVKRRDELLAGFKRFTMAAANGLADDEAVGKAGDFVRMLTDLIKAVDTRRTTVKAPVLEGGRIIDTYFSQQIAKPLEEAKRAVSDKIEAFLRAKQQREREAQAAAAEAQRQEAARLAAEAERRDSSAMMDRALEAEERATATEAAAPTRVIVRSSLGTSVSTRKGPWKMRVVDVSKIPAAYLLPNEPVLLALAKTHAATIEGGTQPIAGVEFYREINAKIR